MLFDAVFPIFALAFNSVRATLAAFCVSLFVSSMTYQGIAKLGNTSYAVHESRHASPVLSQRDVRVCLLANRRVPGAPTFGQRHPARRRAGAATLLYVPAVFKFLSSFVYFNFDRYVWAVVFAALILAICYSSNPVIVNRVTRWMGQISFSLYLLHPMLILGLLGAHKRVAAELGNGPLGLFCRLLLTLSVVGIAASITYVLIEKPGMRFGKKVGAKLSERA